LFLVCGLGNRGALYAYTRHNVGYLVVDRFADRFGISLKKKASGCVVSPDDTFLLAKPDTYMNLSGGPVVSLMKRRGLAPEKLIVIHDDLDMDFGRIRVRWNGSAGGHKGVRSIIETLKSPLFYRIKIGIGRDPVLPPEEYVLSRFREDEVDTLVEILDRAVDALHLFLTDGGQAAMNRYNRS
jgi:peptidyl-tRNA hydrolase, PTH1 family